jgi:hypothetical protein
MANVDGANAWIAVHFFRAYGRYQKNKSISKTTNQYQKKPKKTIDPISPAKTPCPDDATA